LKQRGGIQTHLHCQGSSFFSSPFFSPHAATPFGRKCRSLHLCTDGKNSSKTLLATVALPSSSSPAAIILLVDNSTLRSRRRKQKQKRTELKKKTQRRKERKADHRPSHSPGRRRQHLREAAAEREEHC
jgi:hypothetical protein